MADIICDTNFLIHLATARIRNISDLDVEIGQISFVVPNVVISELTRLSGDPGKGEKAAIALQYAAKLKKLEINGNFADREILDYVRKSGGGIVATLDRELKSKVKGSGGSIVSLSNDRIVLEESQ